MAQSKLANHGTTPRSDAVDPRRAAVRFAGTWVVLIAVAGSVSAEQWPYTLIVGPFRCRADFPITQADPLFVDLANLQTDLATYLKIRPPREWIELYLLADQAAYRRFLAANFPDVPYRRALYVKRGGRGMVMAYRSRDFQIDVRHECTHALLHSVLPLVPLWLDEGLAEYFELPRERRAFDSPYMSNVRWRARLGISPKIEKLESLRDISDMGGSEYQAAWSWVHFMLHGPPEAHRELVLYLQQTEANGLAEPLSRRLRRAIPDLDRQFRAHFRRWQR